MPCITPTSLIHSRQLHHPHVYIMHTKTCPSCNTAKPEEAFGRNRQTPDGLMYYCRECAALKQREYRKANPDAAAQAKSKYLAKVRARNDAARST